MNEQKNLTKEKELTLNDALYYMKMDELKKACIMLSLPCKGKKLELIKRIILFVQTGKVTEPLIIPKQSHVSSFHVQQLNANALMLYGHYKNDAKTRAFFKTLIGPHFHFTAFGIDWLNERWAQSNPPTYQEFADYWIAETERRKQAKSEPKDEWQYIKFLQQMQKEQSLISKEELMARWKKLQADKADLAFEILKSHSFL